MKTHENKHVLTEVSSMLLTLTALSCWVWVIPSITLILTALTLNNTPDLTPVASNRHSPAVQLQISSMTCAGLWDESARLPACLHVSQRWGIEEGPLECWGVCRRSEDLLCKHTGELASAQSNPTTHTWTARYLTHMQPETVCVCVAWINLAEGLY